jgi:hypothetical protein
MTLLDELEPRLAGYNRAGSANRPLVVGEIVGDDEVIVRCDPPTDWQAKQVLGMEVTPDLEAAGYRVELAGGLRRIPGLPRGQTGGTRYGNEAAYRQRDQEPPYLRIRRAVSA